MATEHGQARWPGRRRAGGFTLIELMIAVAIVAILASIANASYQSFVIKSRRAAAATCLQERAHFMERYRTTNLTYVGAPDPAQCGPDLDAFYTIAVGNVTAKTFTLTADPKGAQTKDTKCGKLGITQSGVRTTSGEGGEAECW